MCLLHSALTLCAAVGEIVSIQFVDQRQLPSIDVPTKLSTQKIILIETYRTSSFYSFIYLGIYLGIKPLLVLMRVNKISR